MIYNNIIIDVQGIKITIGDARLSALAIDFFFFKETTH